MRGGGVFPNGIRGYSRFPIGGISRIAGTGGGGVFPNGIRGYSRLPRGYFPIAGNRGGGGGIPVSPNGIRGIPVYPWGGGGGHFPIAGTMGGGGGNSMASGVYWCFPIAGIGGGGGGRGYSQTRQAVTPSCHGGYLFGEWGGGGFPFHMGGVYHRYIRISRLDELGGGGGGSKGSVLPRWCTSALDGAGRGASLFRQGVFSCLDVSGGAPSLSSGYPW